MSTEGRLYLSPGVFSQPRACLPPGREYAEREAAAPGCTEAGCSGERGLFAHPFLFVPRRLFTCPVRVPGVLRLCWPVSCYPMDLTFKPWGVGLWWGTRSLQTPDPRDSGFSGSSFPLFSVSYTSDAACSSPSPHGISVHSYPFLCPRKPQPPVSTWKKQRKSIPTWWSQSSSCGGSSMTCVSGGWSWSPRWICCRHNVRGYRST